MIHKGHPKEEAASTKRPPGSNDQSIKSKHRAHSFKAGPASAFDCHWVAVLACCWASNKSWKSPKRVTMMLRKAKGRQFGASKCSNWRPLTPVGPKDVSLAALNHPKWSDMRNMPEDRLGFCDGCSIVDFVCRLVALMACCLALK